MSKPSKAKRKFDPNPYQVAGGDYSDKQAWAYNNTEKSIDLLVANTHNGQKVVNSIMIRKSVLRNLAGLP